MGWLAGPILVGVLATGALAASPGCPPGRAGAADRIRCGGGWDQVEADASDRVAARCESVIRS